jgi:hypothetical protein
LLKSVAAETKEKKEKKEEEKTAEKPASAAKRTPAAKAAAKPLPQLMEEDVIPALRATLEAQEDVTELELSFQDNKVSFPMFKSC